MREIKFRIWNKVKKQWENGIAMNSHDGSLITNHNEDFEINQFTGLHDATGKEIYEGDIVREVHVDPDEGVNKVFQWPVVWLDKCAAFGDADDGGTHVCDIGCFEDGSVEIIGNIYQHPDLIK